MNIQLITSTVSTVVSVALLILVGFIGVKVGILKKHTMEELSAYMVYIAVPCTIIAKLYALESVSQALIGVGLSAATQIISVLVGYALLTLTRAPEDVKGVGAACFGICNSGFIGLPIVTMLFGEAAKNIAIYYIISNNIVFWTLGAYFIKLDAKVKGTLKLHEKRNLVQKLKGINPPVAAFIVMLIVAAVKMPLPRFFLGAVELIDHTTSPAALIFCGIVLGIIGFKNIKWKKGFSVIMAGRYIISPLIMVGLFMLFPQTDLFQKVLIIQSAMPVVTLVELGANKYGGDVEYASLAFVFSLFILIFSLPIIYYILMA